MIAESARCGREIRSMNIAMRPKPYLPFTHPLLGLLLICFSALAWAEEEVDFEDESEWLSIDDKPLAEPLVHPDWFKVSFLNLREDLEEAVAEGKAGIIVYFGQDRCPYCKLLMDVNFAKKDIEAYTREHFDVIAIDAWGDRLVSDMNGEELSEKSLADREQTNFTPALIFYDAQGRQALRLRGYHDPYHFRAALEYVADGHYTQESFPRYLARAKLITPPGEGELNPQPFFSPPPYALDRSLLPGQRPLAVFFEQAQCHACEVLHSGPLANLVIRGQLEFIESVQLDRWSQTPVVTPAGKRSTSAEWAEELGLFYTPTIVFFDKQGKEILRVDSVVHFYRLRMVLDYILSGAYERGLNLQQWRRSPLPGAPRANH